MQGVLLWQEYQTLRFKIWGTKVCHHSHERKYQHPKAVLFVRICPTVIIYAL